MGMQVPLRMSVDVISFSAHADFKQTSGFVEALDPAHVILVHGEAVEMGRLRKELEKQADTAGRKCTLYTPKVGQPVHITHPSQHTIRVSPLVIPVMDGTSSKSGWVQYGCLVPARYKTAISIAACLSSHFHVQEQHWCQHWCRR